MRPVFVGVGSNIDPRTHVPRALALLETRFGALRVSRAYRCPSVGFDGDDFINLVIGFDSDEPVADLQAALRRIETDCGRDRSVKRASRRMDLDLLLVGDTVLDRDGLTLPRADILEYAFVLRPLAELVPDARHPVLGSTYAALWAAFDDREQPLTPVMITP